MRLNILILVVLYCLAIQTDLTFQYDQSQNINDWYRREHSLAKPYGGTGTGIPYWDFVGSTIVSNKFIRLTADSQSLQGGLWNTIPVQFKDWEIQFQFKNHGHGKDLFGDGFAMWYVKERNNLGPVFGSNDFFTGMAIFLDTYSNHNGPHNHPHPYISAMINNGSLHYDHDKDGTNTELAGCEAPFRNKDYDTFVAVRYQNYKLTVSTDIENKNVWKECFTSNNVKLPTNYYFGFSAATGELSDNHDIVSVKVYQLDSERNKETFDAATIIPEAEQFEKPREHRDDEKPSVAWKVFKWFFIVVFIVVAIGAVVGLIWWLVSRQQRTKKRFY